MTNANDNPVVLIDNDSDANSVSESASNGATVGVTGLGTDADSGTSVSYTLADDAGGRFAIDASTGVVTVADASGLDYESASSHDIQITATSSDGSVTTETFTINVTNANDNPVANSDDLLDGNEDTTSAVLNSDMLSNDTDLDGDMLSITHINGTALTGGVQSITVTNGTVNVDSAGNITFTPALNYVGDVSFEYTVSDSNGGSDSAIVGGTIVNVNDAPVAVDDTVLTSENTPITLTVADIVTPNDTDEDGDTLTISGVGNAANGSVVLNGDGSVTFTPDTDFTGEATFDYTVNDGNGGTDTATVRVNVPGLRDNAGEVYEEALSTGSNSSSNAETTSGNLLSDDLALPSGALSLSVSIVGGTVNNSVMGQTVVTTAEGNVLIVNTDNTDAGFGDYTYTLLNPIDHNLIQQDFTLGAEGWSGSGVSQQLGQLRIARDSTATQTFSFGSEMAGKQVVLSFDLNVSGGWDTSGGSRDYFNVSANGDLVNSSSPADASTSRISTTLTLDGNGEAVITLNADTTANSEIANIDNLSITAVNLTDQFTYTLDDGAGFVESANLNVAIYDDLADTPRDYDESTTFTEDQDLSVGTFNLLDNATPQSGSSISSVSNLTLFVNGADAAADFTITSGSAGSGEAARYSFIHNDTFASAELVVYDNGDVTWENGYENLFDFMSPGDMAQLQISYVTSVGGTSDSSIATLNISGVNDGPTAVTDSGLTSGGFASEFWVYNEGEDGPNLESVAQVIGFTGSNTPDATFISTGLSYSVVSGDSDYRANLGSNNHLEDWLADGGDEGSVVRNTTESSGDAIVRFAGVFEVETAGQFTLDITHDDGFIVFIDGVETFTADFITSPSNFVQTTNLSAGSHDVEIYYWDQGGEYVFDGSLYDSSNNDLWTPANLSYRGAPISTEEDEAVTVDVLANDWDIEGDSLTVIGVTNGANGTASTNGSTVVYTPNAGFFGLDSFTYTISDGNGGTDSVSVSVEVRPENNAALIDLDGDDSSGKSGSDYFAAAPLWNPVAVVDSDVSITDIDGSSLFSAKIEILNPMAGDELVVSGGSLPSNIGFSYNEISGVGLLSGFASLAEYQSALQLIHLDNNDSSVTGDRSIEISVNDGNDQSMVATSTIRVTNNEQSGDTTDNEIDASWATADSITLHGNGGNDTLTAGSLDDALFGGEGDDTLIGNAGSDVLIGGLGADTFEWKLGDEGTTSAPAEDVVLDFSTDQGDSLDLSDLLRVDGEDNITDYLHAESDGTDTVIHISQSGGFEGDYATHTSATDQVITLEGVDLSGQGSSDQIIQYLIDGNHLSID
ncbi:cadherin-like domain-containing protein [uncultured Gilvimarinus sp.]|uniref:Ig-like domain-containing protein n=1 Tax=uncultured Gilvimarinus sp. TaxID=1689143 RepID=UPI0030DB28C8